MGWFDWFGGPPAPPVPPTPPPPLPTLPNDPEVNLAVSDSRRPQSPYGAPQILWPLDKLVAKRGLYVFDDMLRDGQCRACLDVRAAATVGPGWTLEPGAPDDADAKALAARLTDDLRRIPGGFESLLLALVRSSMAYGYALAEKTYAFDEDRVRLAEVRMIAPHLLLNETDCFGHLTAILQPRAAGQPRLPPAKFIRLVNRNQFDPLGESELAAAYEPYFKKTFMTQLWSQFAERLALPPLIAQHPAGASKAQVDAVLQILERLQANTTLTLPAGGDWSLKLLETTRDPRAMFEAAIAHYNEEISIALLTPSKLGLTAGGTSGVTAHGSLALAQSQFDIFLLIISLQARQLEACIQQELIAQMAALDNPHGVPVPVFKVLPLDQDKLKVIQTVAQAVTAGALVPDAGVEQRLRELLDLPAAETDPPLPPRPRRARTDSPAQRGSLKLGEPRLIGADVPRRRWP
jgi:phage gp29-like protein